ncbi:oxidase [Hyphodiscus hymeniophilus]|uniref:Oxidase n=1 Tax=Hyphodiscus hymeniophilus TaxID=353542 RepID=A0A9P6VF59_9HELO|nr:oxidase [Hyphodiscus hymeniophilus]
MTSKSYVIVGSGVFGASTAYHLSKAHPESSITLLDRSSSFPCPLAASHDFNKIVRADYGSLFYCELALKARELWKNDSLYKSFYHQSGMVVMDESDLGRRIIGNYKSLNEETGSEIVGPDEMKKRYDGLFAKTDYRGVEDIFVNPTSGWAEATPAVKKVIEAAVRDCTGVRLASGKTLHAIDIILCTGAGTAKLLADSAPDWKELQVMDRIAAAGVVTGVAKLNTRQQERFRKSPVFVHAVGEVQGEVLPPTPDGFLKFCVDVSFMNTSLHKGSGQMITQPPDQEDQAQHTVSQQLKDECARVMKGIYGKELDDAVFDSFRICWDGYTPNQDFIISSHPRCQNLYVATAGSFHGWKFLPILGQYVVKLLDGELDNDLVQRWAWDRPQVGSAHEKVKPKRELRDLI